MKTSLPVLPDDLPNRLGSLRLRHFRLVERLISEGTMHKAARTMNITQPAASLMLRELESAIGVSLFERSRRGMTATAAGMMLLDRARAILGEARFIAEQSRNDDSESRLLCVGALPRVMLDLMPAVAERVRLEWPQLRLRFVEGVAAQLLDALRLGEVDCVIARLTHDRVAANATEFHQHKLYDEGMCLVAGARSPWARRRRLRLADLMTADWILPPAQTEAREVFTNTFLQEGFAPPLPRIESLAVVTNMNLVQHLPYMTIAPSAAAHEWQRLGRLKVLPVPLNRALSPIAFICRHSNRGTDSIHRLENIVAECAAQRRRSASQKT